MAASARAAGVSERTGRRWRAEVPPVLRNEGSSGLAEPELTSFVGRRADLATLEECFEGSCRLVTVLGPPGIGKTRLSLRFVASRSDESVFCDLRAVHTVAELCAEVGRSLDLRLGQGQRGDESDVGRALAARRRCTVLLDNFEQIAPAGAACVSAWLRMAPEARFVVTSRRVLRIAGEHVVELGPLGLSSKGDAPDGDALSLFLSRACATEPAFDANASVLETAHALVRRLEGVPLAIELAAGQMRRTDPAGLLARLDHTPLEMERTVTDGDARHASMRDAIRSSWCLLSSSERAALSQLTVFRGGFSVEAAEAVLDLARPGPPVHDVLAALRETSLLRVVEGRGERRWDMYEVIREFASEQLASSVRGETCDRHAAHFASLGLPWPYNESQGPSASLRERLSDEYDNLNAALEHSLGRAESIEATQLARLGMMIHAVLSARMPSRAVDAVSQVLDAIESRDDSVESVGVAQLLLSRAESRRATGAYEDAQSDLGKAKEKGGRGALVARIECEEGMVAFESGYVRVARRHAEAALKIAETSGCRATEGYVHRFLGYVLTEAFNDRAGFAHFDRAMVLADCVEDQRLRATAHVWSCAYRLRFGDGTVLERAEALLQQALVDRDPYSRTKLLFGLGWWRQDHEEYEEAAACHQAASTIAAQHGLRYQLGCAAMNQAFAFDEGGRIEEASYQYARAADVFGGIRAPRLLALVQLHWSGLKARLGERQVALRLLREAEQTLRELGEPCLLTTVECQRRLLDIAGDATSDVDGRSHSTAPLQARSREVLPDVKPTRLLGANLSTRVVWRLLCRQLSHLSDRPLGHWVSEDGVTFRTLQGTEVVLRNRPVMRRVLAALVEARCTHPGLPVAHDELLRRGWPGERMRADAGVARLRAIVARLRRLGLGDAVVTAEAGYLLHASVDVEGSSSRSMSRRIG